MTPPLALYIAAYGGLLVATCRSTRATRAGHHPWPIVLMKGSDGIKPEDEFAPVATELDKAREMARRGATISDVLKSTKERLAFAEKGVKLRLNKAFSDRDAAVEVAADAAVAARKAVKSARNANKEKAVLQQTVAEVEAARDAATARATEAEDLAKRAEEDATRADARAKEAARVASLARKEVGAEAAAVEQAREAVSQALKERDAQSARAETAEEKAARTKAELEQSQQKLAETQAELKQGIEFAAERVGELDDALEFAQNRLQKTQKALEQRTEEAEKAEAKAAAAAAKAEAEAAAAAREAAEARLVAQNEAKAAAAAQAEKDAAIKEAEAYAERAKKEKDAAIFDALREKAKAHADKTAAVTAANLAQNGGRREIARRKGCGRGAGECPKVKAVSEANAQATKAQQEAAKALQARDETAASAAAGEDRLGHSRCCSIRRSACSPALRPIVKKRRPMRQGRSQHRRRRLSVPLPRSRVQRARWRWHGRGVDSRRVCKSRGRERNGPGVTGARGKGVRKDSGGGGGGGRC